ncbi:hypothetical protein YC2023_027714 [Brassica napus]
MMIRSRSAATTAARSLGYLRHSSALVHSPLLSGATATPVRHFTSPVNSLELDLVRDMFVNRRLLVIYSYQIKPPIVNPHLASYGVENPIYAVMQLAQTTMRSELGKITLDKTFEERDALNVKIVLRNVVYVLDIVTSNEMESFLQEAINVAAKDWGLECLRYEIRDIMPPNGVRVAMEMQAEAERKKRAQILESEGERQAHINIADGKKSSVILESEAAKMDQVNRASGEAEAILARAQATARGLAMLSQSLKETGGVEAASLRVAEQYIQAFGNIAKEGTTMLLPSSAANPANMIAQALTMYKSLVPNGGIQETSAVESSSKAK